MYIPSLVRLVAICLHPQIPGEWSASTHPLRVQGGGNQQSWPRRPQRGGAAANFRSRSVFLLLLLQRAIYFQPLSDNLVIDRDFQGKPSPTLSIAARLMAMQRCLRF